MITNHWGIYVDSETPITGVINNNSVEFLNDEIFSSNSIDLDYEEFLSENPTEEEIEFYESDNSTYLIGDWLKDDNGKYYPDQTGEYAAITGEIYTQVVFSKVTKRVRLCSPCYPGQGDLDSDGDYLAYNLPLDLIGNL
jgi:hypothetical protein